MSSLWSHAQTVSGAGMADTSLAPKPGNGTTNRMASIAASAKGGASAATGAAPAEVAASAATSSTSSSGSGAAITANDFLTLLVTEMQNQDPTADTDPNEYINQLVQINSLEQLISINQNLSTVLGTASSSSSTSSDASSSSASGAVSHLSGAKARAGDSAGHEKQAVSQHASSSATASSHAISSHATHGNLSVPAASGASHAVAHGLDGHPHLGAGSRTLRDIPTGAMAR